MTTKEAYFCWYWKSRKGKAAQRKYKRSAKGKATAKRASVKYWASAKGRAARARAQEVRP